MADVSQLLRAWQSGRRIGERGGTLAECPHTSGLELDAWRAGFKSVTVPISNRPASAQLQESGNVQRRVPERPPSGEVNARTSSRSAVVDQSQQLRKMRESPKPIANRSLGNVYRSQNHAQGNDRRAATNLNARQTGYQLTVRPERPAFGGSCLPVTMKLASLIRQQLARRLTNSPSSWPYVDRVVVWLLPSLKTDACAFHENDGPAMTDLFRSDQLESIDRSLVTSLIRRIGERVIGRRLIEAFLANDLS